MICIQRSSVTWHAYSIFKIIVTGNKYILKIALILSGISEKPSSDDHAGSFCTTVY